LDGYYFRVAIRVALLRLDGSARFSLFQLVFQKFIFPINYFSRNSPLHLLVMVWFLPFLKKKTANIHWLCPPIRLKWKTTLASVVADIFLFSATRRKKLFPKQTPQKPRHP